MMGAQLIEQARIHSVKKFVCIGTICAYPAWAAVPFKEDAIWEGYPEPTNAPYGIAKKALLVQLQAYRQQYGMNGIYLLPVNLYGPHDNFDLESSHVIPALIRKCIEARNEGRDEVHCWGSGAATREFLYVDDCASAIVNAAQRYDAAAPVNIGSGEEISIRDLAARIAKLCRFEGRLVWDATKPDGQARRCLDTSRAREAFGFEAAIGLDDGLRRTVDWFEGQAR
jgi:GDP-L-fucose synthase